jgi:hypothetical protein
VVAPVLIGTAATAGTTEVTIEIAVTTTIAGRPFRRPYFASIHVSKALTRDDGPSPADVCQDGRVTCDNGICTLAVPPSDAATDE